MGFGPTYFTAEAAAQCCLLAQQLRIARRISIQQRQQTNLRTLRSKPLGHFESHHAAQRAPADKVRAVGLQLAHLFDVVRGHVFYACVRGVLAVKARRLKTLEELAFTEKPRQFTILEHVAAERVDAEERRL